MTPTDEFLNMLDTNPPGKWALLAIQELKVIPKAHPLEGLVDDWPSPWNAIFYMAAEFAVQHPEAREHVAALIEWRARMVSAQEMARKGIADLTIQRSASAEGARTNREASESRKRLILEYASDIWSRNPNLSVAAVARHVIAAVERYRPPAFINDDGSIEGHSERSIRRQLKSWPRPQDVAKTEI